MPTSRTSNRLVTAAVALILVALTVVAAIALHQIQALSLPIPKSTGIATLLLPILTGLSLYPSSPTPLSKKAAQPWLTLTLFLLLTIYETVIITLSFTHMVPPSDLACHLDRHWQGLYSAKNAESIKRIQDRHNCCGLHSVRDMAWPFPGKGRPVTACASTFGRERSCFGAWRRDEQVMGGLLLLVAVGTFLVKVSVLLFVRPRAPWMEQYRRRATANDETDETPAASRSQGRIEPQYHDDEAEEVTHGAHDTENDRAITQGNDHAEGPAMQPSSFQGHSDERARDRNEWA